jgi:hypothetical protein
VTRRIGALLTAIALLAVGMAAVIPAQHQVFTKTASNFISIRKITPRTGADLVTPSQLPFFIDVEYATSLQKAEVLLTIMKKVGNGPLRPLIKPVLRTVSKGKGTLQLRSPYVNLTKSAREEKTLITVSLRKIGGKELAFSQSFNYLQGAMKARMSSLAPSTDTMEILNYRPRETTKIRAGQNQDFNFKFSYSLKSKKIAFINIEFSDAETTGTGMCWKAIVVPLQQGMGIVEIDTEPIFFPAALEGKSMGIGLLYRLDPLGGTHMIRYIKSFKFSAHRAPFARISHLY